jgi:haloalkane dehalogenase
MINYLKTPEERFGSLPGFACKPQYVEGLEGYGGLTMHYVDEGPKDSENVFLCLHGQPTWSYLYRKMIPIFTKAGHRTLAPDYFGFGRSDKPTDEAVYTFSFHRNSLIRFIEKLNLKNITLVVQDWGGLLGLTLPMDMEERFSNMVVMNTTLGTGDVKLSPGFLAWREWNNKNPDMEIAKLMKRACPHLSDAESAAYEAPFPGAQYKAGVRRFPNIVPDNPDAEGADISRRAKEWLKTRWNGGVFMAVGMKDPVLGPPVMKGLRKIIKGCPDPYEVENGGHFLQEWGEEVAKKALEALGL